MKKIVFYHYHVNGDCYISRIFVKKIIESTRHMNVEYFYYAPRAIDSYSSDLGIPETNFNSFGELPQEFEHTRATFIGDTLGINIWIGFAREKYNICVFCLENIINYYNDFIDNLNQTYSLNISHINQTYPYISFDYYFYECQFLRHYMQNLKKKFTKTIILYNVLPTTFISICHVNFEKILHIFSHKYPEYMFITFLPSNTHQENVTSMSDIFKRHNRQIPAFFPIHFSYLSIYSDKVIMSASGICQFCFNEQNMNIHNKIAMIYDNTPEGNPTDCPFCNNYEHDQLLCIQKYNLYVNMIKFTYNYNEDLLTNELDNFIRK